MANMIQTERQIFTSRGIQLNVIRGEENDCPDLRALNHEMNTEHSLLLPTTVEEMELSFRDGLAIVLTSEKGDAVGYLRFSPLLDEMKKRRLELPCDIPDILEIGSAYISPSYRGGVYSAFRNEALSMILPKIQSEKILVLGTTKAIKVLHAAQHAEELGINFQRIVHTDLDMIAPLTCVCHGTFGRGMQSSQFCPRRITQREIQNVDAISEERNGKIPCTMYVSNSDLAERTNDRLRNMFNAINPRNPQQAWIQALRGVQHYE